MLLCWWFRCAVDFVVLVISFVLVILLRWCCSLVISLCWCFRCAGDVVVLVISLCWWFRCAGDFVVLVMFAGDVCWCVRCAGDFVVLVMLLCWWFCCAGAVRWWFRCDFIALVMLLCCWWFCCAGGDVVVLVSCLFVNCWSGAFAATMSARCVKKNVRFPIAEVWTRSPRTWIHSGSWLPSCLVIKTMSVNLSIDLCCVISVFVCKCCGLSVAMPMANSPTPLLQRNYLNHYRDTQYQPRIIIHNSGIYLVENYFLHSAPLFSFSNSRSAKSKTWLRAVALLQTWHLNAMRQRLNAMRMTYIYIYIFNYINKTLRGLGWAPKLRRREPQGWRRRVYPGPQTMSWGFKPPKKMGAGAPLKE